MGYVLLENSVDLWMSAQKEQQADAVFFLVDFAVVWRSDT